MKKKIMILLLSAMTMTAAHAQSQPAGMRVEVAEAETDHGDYSIFTYKDSEADDSFGYYLGLGRTAKFLGADEILGLEIHNLHEVTIWLGSDTDEAMAALASLLDLYGKAVETTVEFKGRAATNGFKLGDPVTTICVVKKKLIGGKRLEFFFPEGKHIAHVYLPKSVVKELRTTFKLDIKLHPKQHRKP